MLCVLPFLFAATSVCSPAPDASEILFGSIEAAMLAERETELIAIVEDLVDFEAMARLSLGRSRWLSASAGQQRRFVSLFRGLVLARLLLQLQGLRYAQLTLELLGRDRASPGFPGYEQLRTKVETLGWKIDFRMRDGRVYNIVFEGTNLATNYRAQFDHLLDGRGKTFDELLAVMAERSRYQTP